MKMTTQHRVYVSATDSIIKVFSQESNHLYNKPTDEYPIGIALTEEFNFVSNDSQQVKIIQQ